MGRNKKEDPKKTLWTGVEESIIETLGGDDATKEVMYNAAVKAAKSIKRNEKKKI